MELNVKECVFEGGTLKLIGIISLGELSWTMLLLKKDLGILISHD